MENVAIYARVSTARQEQEDTIESQIGAIKDRLAKDGLRFSPSHLYKDEGYSGSILERPALDELRAACKQGKYDYIYVYDYGRLSRELTNLMIIKDDLERHGAQVVSLFEAITGDPDTDRLQMQIMGAVHEYERKKITKRFHNGKIQKAKRGELVGYNPPYGYSYNKDLATIVPYEPEAIIVRKIFEWVAYDGLSVYGVIKKLYDSGIAPRKKRQSAWTKGPVDRILRNETYIGKHHYNKSEAVIASFKLKPAKYKRQQKDSRRPRPREQWIPHSVNPIISKDLFERAQEELKRFKKFRKRNSQFPYLLTGAIECTCGSKRNGDGPDGKKYYRCTSRNKHYDNINRCKVGGINVKILDHLVWQELERILQNPKQIRAYAERWKKSLTAPDANGIKTKSLIRQISTIRAEQQRYIDAYGKGILAEAPFSEKMATTNSSIELLEQDLAKSSQNTLKPGKLDIDLLVNKASTTIQKLDFENKRFIIQRVVDKIIASPEEVRISGFIPVVFNEQLNKEKVKYEPFPRHRGAAKRWQVHTV